MNNYILLVIIFFASGVLAEFAFAFAKNKEVQGDGIEVAATLAFLTGVGYLVYLLFS